MYLTVNAVQLFLSLDFEFCSLDLDSLLPVCWYVVKSETYFDVSIYSGWLHGEILRTCEYIVFIINLMCLCAFCVGPHGALVPVKPTPLGFTQCKNCMVFIYLFLWFLLGIVGKKQWWAFWKCNACGDKQQCFHKACQLFMWNKVLSRQTEQASASFYVRALFSLASWWTMYPIAESK